VPVIAGASDTSTFGTVQLARYAEDVGADAVMVMPTYGGSPRAASSPRAVKEAIDFYGELSRAVDLPILVYNSASLSTHLPVRALSEIFEYDNVVGMEETSLEYPVISRVCTALGDKVSVLVRSQVLLAGLEMGAQGGITPVGFSKIGRDVYEAYRDDQRAKALRFQKVLCSIPPEELSHKPSISFYKEAVRQMGLNVGPPRSPVTLLDDQEKNVVSRLIREYGLDTLKNS